MAIILMCAACAGSGRDCCSALVHTGPSHIAHPEPRLVHNAHHSLPLLAYRASRERCVL